MNELSVNEINWMRALKNKEANRAVSILACFNLQKSFIKQPKNFFRNRPRRVARIEFP